MDYFTFLNQVSPITQDEYDLMASHFIKKEYAKGAIILQEGAIQKDILLVIEGIQMSYYYHNERQYIMAFSYPPSPSGVPESFQEQLPSGFCLQAMSDSRFYSLDFNIVQSLFDQSQALERLFRRMTEIIFRGTIQRVVELQSYSMEERFRVFAKRSPHLFQLIPHKYLASYMNISVIQTYLPLLE